MREPRLRPADDPNLLLLTDLCDSLQVPRRKISDARSASVPVGPSSRLLRRATDCSEPGGGADSLILRVAASAHYPGSLARKFLILPRVCCFVVWSSVGIDARPLRRVVRRGGGAQRAVSGPHVSHEHGRSARPGWGSTAAPRQLPTASPCLALAQAALPRCRPAQHHVRTAPPPNR